MLEPERKAVTPSLEAQLASALRALMAKTPVGSEFAADRRLCDALEYFISRQLALRHREWSGESLDGVFPACASKTGPFSAELAGACILITDQAWTPFAIELSLAASNDSIESFRVRLGERGGGRLGISWPPNKVGKLRASLADRLRDIAWVYRIASDDT